MGYPKSSAKPPAPPAALLTHSPGPGVYSRLERAVESLPKTVKLDSLDNRLRRHPEGVSKVELEPFYGELRRQVSNLEVLDNSGRPIRELPRQQVLDIVRQSSPAYTHGEYVLSGGQDTYPLPKTTPEPGRIGEPVRAGGPRWEPYSEAKDNAGENYREFLLTTPNLPTIRHSTYRDTFDGGHFAPLPAIGHLRTLDVGDSIRIQELQSDLKNKNIKRQSRGEPLYPTEAIAESFDEVLLKSLLLRAAREGKNAIEVIPFDRLKRYVNLRDGGIQHTYGGVIPKTLQRIANPMGGLEVAQPFARSGDAPPAAVRQLEQAQRQYADILQALVKQETAFTDALVAAGGVRKGGSLDVDLSAPGLYQGGRPNYSPSTSNRAISKMGTTIPESRAQLLMDLRERLAQSLWARRAGGQISDELVLGSGSQAGLNKLRLAAARGLIDVTDIARSSMPEAAEIYGLVDSGMPGVARASELLYDRAQEHYRSMSKLRDAEVAAMPAGSAPAASSRFVISPELRKRLIQGGIGLGILAPLMGGGQQQNQETR